MEVVSARAVIRPNGIKSVMDALGDVDVRDVRTESFDEGKVTGLWPMRGWSSTRLSE
jgi:hypothetical protein